MNGPYAKRILQSYAEQGIWPKWYSKKRWRDSPFEFVESFVPKEGSILDIGCGYGLFASLLAVSSQKRSVCGVDIDPRRINVAQQSATDKPNLQFHCIAFDEIKPIPAYNAIIFFDVLHHLSEEQQETMIQESYTRLLPEGLILIKDVSTRPRYKYLWNYLADSMTGLLNITSGSTLHYRSPENMLGLLKKNNFHSEVFEVHKRGLYPHILYRGIK